MLWITENSLTPLTIEGLGIRVSNSEIHSLPSLYVFLLMKWFLCVSKLLSTNISHSLHTLPYIMKWNTHTHTHKIIVYILKQYIVTASQYFFPHIFSHLHPKTSLKPQNTLKTRLRNHKPIETQPRKTHK